MRYRAERGDRNHHRTRRPVGVAAEQWASVELRVGAQPIRESGQPYVGRAVRQREREQETDRFRALGGKIREVDAQRLASDGIGGILGKEMHAADDGIGLEHDIAAGWRHQDRGVIGKAERARMRCERTKITRDQPILRGTLGLLHHRA